ncbi:unnamed protein product [Caenorhabditis auriculariae]|uniref:Uncharacterized protein n=1 Tax=Caenorhabditis auriculariae TaxID=2777116 RepID=A0A8S1HAE8_9PELO|nr:unnamed protein product [Caenorhabditis auriculariae]
MRLILLLQLIFLGKSQLNNVHYAFSYSETHETQAEHISVGVDITNLNQSSVLYRFVLLTWTSRLTYFVDGENCLTETEPCDRLLFINRTFVNVTVHQGGKILDIITFQHQENGQLPKVFVLGCGQDISSRHCVHAIRETFAIPSNREEICVCQYTFPQCSDECFTQDACIDGKPWWHTPANQIGRTYEKDFFCLSDHHSDLRSFNFNNFEFIQRKVIENFNDFPCDNKGSYVQSRINRNEYSHNNGNCLAAHISVFEEFE